MHPILSFLTDLSQNNNREWFAANRTRYEESLTIFRNMVTELIARIAQFDPSVQYLQPHECIFRIYRDIRFSHNKLPYKNHFGAYMAVGGGRKSPYAGYYLHLEPNGNAIGGGIYGPDALMLKRIRKFIDVYHEELKEIVETPDFAQTFGSIVTYDSLQRVPMGYATDHPAAEWLKYKHFMFEKALPNEALLEPDFMQRIVNDFACAKRFNDFFNSELMGKE